MTTQRKPAPEVDRGGRVYYIEAGKVYEGRRCSGLCHGCRFFPRDASSGSCVKQSLACMDEQNGGRGHRTLHPVQAVG